MRDEPRVGFAIGTIVLGVVLGIIIGLFLVERAETRRVSTSSCQRQDKAVVVDLDNVKHHRILRHVWVARRHGFPTRLHIARDEAAANRAASLQGIPTKPGMDRDEYPPAMSDEGGADASVWYVDSAENRSAGSVMGHQLSDFCNGQRFRFERRP